MVDAACPRTPSSVHQVLSRTEWRVARCGAGVWGQHRGTLGRWRYWPSTFRPLQKHAPHFPVSGEADPWLCGGCPVAYLSFLRPNTCSIGILITSSKHIHKIRFWYNIIIASCMDLISNFHIILFWHKIHKKMHKIAYLILKIDDFTLSSNGYHILVSF
jgi:hypothetical protein